MSRPRGSGGGNELLNAASIGRAEAEIERAVRTFVSGTGSIPRGTVVTAPAGAGKSFLISNAVGIARKAGMRVAVAAPTNEQAFGLVRSIATLNPGLTVTFVPAQGVTLPPSISQLRGVQVQDATNADREPLIVGTLSKFGDAFCRTNRSTGRPALSQRDGLLLDEAFQADSARYFAGAGIATNHLLVGDGGQISPFSTMDDPTRWRGLPEDPLQTSVGVLLRNHPNTPVFGLPITRRLSPKAVPIASLFYPKLQFEAAVMPSARKLELVPVVTKDRNCIQLDGVLDLAVNAGWAHLELPEEQVLMTDQQTIQVIVDLVRRLFARGPRVSCERIGIDAKSPLSPKQVAIGVSHNDQKDLIRVALDHAGFSDVVVETANKLQGLEFEFMFVWHPLAGLPEPDEFHLDPGRMCVLLTRHRHACVVIGRAGDSGLLSGVPPSTPAYLDWDPDPVLDGWEIHNNVFHALEKFRIRW